ncbi:DHH family phosphoesterase [Anaerostipes sp.]|uniref:DHH family phosphoesterase n=1 Tax=Anaerostipes sp. TaxID=1872530 RepID=UPI0025BC8134|nr:bifunctional oligoribonuclease/PAP phosphatase NrnA [Anaerostipes sp.]MBS7007297.1 bifunctional oligoribonuclease/PAP phosphatase NrnA [Anaerostipes sp.]
MNEFISSIEAADSIAITGHIHPDGDCIGSCLGLRQYILDNFPGKSVTVYLESPAPEFQFLSGADSVRQTAEAVRYDLFFVLDCSSLDRIEPFISMYETAAKTFCIDHHISSKGIGQEYILKPQASATCEVLYELFDSECISLECAYCLYTGIVHDTGVFKHSNTTKQTMEYAGDLISKGINTSRVIDETFYQKTFTQNRVLGQALLNSSLYEDGQIILSYLKSGEMEQLGADSGDTNGIIDQMRITKGVEAAVFLYALDADTYKVSMRSNGKVNVASISEEFKGGGHIRAAGFSMKADLSEVTDTVLSRIRKQL